MNEDFIFCDPKGQTVYTVRENTVNSSSGNEQQVAKFIN
jgi:hypothetical protein